MDFILKLKEEYSLTRYKKFAQIGSTYKDTNRLIRKEREKAYHTNKHRTADMTTLVFDNLD